MKPKPYDNRDTYQETAGHWHRTMVRDTREKSGCGCSACAEFKVDFVGGDFGASTLSRISPRLDDGEGDDDLREAKKKWYDAQPPRCICSTLRYLKPRYERAQRCSYVPSSFVLSLLPTCLVHEETK